MENRIGKQLTQAREALGLIVEDVAHRTKIPAATIRNLEREDYSHFPNNVYAKSFLRLYGKHLGIDTASYLADRDGRLMSHEDEVAFLEGIAISPEFQNVEEKQEAAASSAAAMAAANTTGEVLPGKISSGFMTVLLLFVVGVPTAFLLSKLYGAPEDKPTPAAAAPGETDPAIPDPAPAPIDETPVVPDETPPALPAPRAGIASTAETGTGAVDETVSEDEGSAPIAPTGDAPGALPDDPEAIVPRATLIEEPSEPASVETAITAPISTIE